MLAASLIFDVPSGFQNFDLNYNRIKYQMFKVKFLLDKITADRLEKAHVIRREKLFHIRLLKKNLYL